MNTTSWGSLHANDSIFDGHRAQAQISDSIVDDEESCGRIRARAGQQSLQSRVRRTRQRSRRTVNKGPANTKIMHQFIVATRTIAAGMPAE